jgi:TM2 domain-containing membrane protein YozV
MRPTVLTDILNGDYGMAAHWIGIKKLNKINRKFGIKGIAALNRSGTRWYRVLLEGRQILIVNTKTNECEQDSFNPMYDEGLVSRAKYMTKTQKLTRKDILKSALPQSAQPKHVK